MRIVFLITIGIGLSTPLAAMDFEFANDEGHVCETKNSQVKGGTLTDYVCLGSVRGIDKENGNILLCRYAEEDWLLNGQYYKQLSRSASCADYFTGAPAKNHIYTTMYGGAVIPVPIYS